MTISGWYHHDLFDLIIIIITVPVSNAYTMGMKRDKKDDEDNGGTGGGHPYSNLEKTSVLQEAR